ncbi:vitamin K-dependent gamma-carboxylase [Ixodes scapularis]
MNRMSVDSWRSKFLNNTDVPRWNYILIRAQIFCVYFIAGLKKMDKDWIGGHSMRGLSKHWVFDGFKLILSEEQIDFYVVHWGGFLLDLTVGFVMATATIRPVGALFCILFNAMNSRMFTIGMFPYTMIALSPTFFDCRWPKALIERCPSRLRSFTPDTANTKPNLEQCWYPIESKGCDEGRPPPMRQLRKWKMTTFFICLHFALQLFLPYSHGITKGYNTWTEGSYGYSWDMMVHNWRPIHIKTVLYDNSTGKAHFLNPEQFTTSTRWYHQADMVVQFAHCVRDRVRQEFGMKNVEFYIDVWMSLNGRFAQRFERPFLL